MTTALPDGALPDAARLRALINQLEAGLLERETAARLAFLAALAGEHLLLIGPPGTAKSALARRLHRLFAQAPYFERLLTRFSTPEELFGPLSLKALENDRYERLVDGFLPTAGIAFLDEVFKANSAILNALLTLLNEREFDQGGGRIKTPLVCVIAASNEVPADDSLEAFYDRFLLRMPVAPVHADNFAALLNLAPAAPAPPTLGRPEGWPAPISAVERQALAQAAAGVALGAEALQACQALRNWLAQEGLPVSDRRWRQWVGLMRVAAAAEGRMEVDLFDLWLAPYVVSPTPEQVPRVAQWLEDEALQLPSAAAPWLTRAVEAFEMQLSIEQSAPPEHDDGAAGKLALARALGRSSGPDAAPGMAGPAETAAQNSALLRLQIKPLEDASQRRYSTVHQAARLRQCDELLGPLERACEDLARQHAALRAALAPRLWLAPPLAQRWLNRAAQAQAAVGQLLARLQVARAGFAALRLDPDLPPEPVAPVVWEPDAAHPA